MVLDAGGSASPVSPDLLRCLAVISPNETELQGLTGKAALPLSGDQFGCPLAAVPFDLLSLWLVHYSSVLCSLVQKRMRG